jgi:hypothetical protein
MGESTPRFIGKDHASLNYGPLSQSLRVSPSLASKLKRPRLRVKMTWGLFCLLDF